MPRPSIPRSHLIRIPLILPILLILLSGCGMTGSQKLAEDSDPDAIVDAIAESKRAEEASSASSSLAASSPSMPLTETAENYVTRRAFGEASDESTAELPPIPMRTIMPVSTNSSLTKQQMPSAPMAPAANLTDQIGPTAMAFPAATPPTPVAATQFAQYSPRTVTKVTAATFQSTVIESKIPVLVDFYTDWCGPCKQLAPELERFAHNEAGLRVVKVNAEHDKRLAQQYRVRSYPTVILFNNGVPVAQFIGTTKIRNALRR